MFVDVRYLKAHITYMNQKGFITPLLIIIVVVALVGGGYYFFQQSRTQTGSETGQTSEEGGFTGTVADLLARGQNTRCTFANTDAAGTTNGTFYVTGQGQKVRGDFTVTPLTGTATSGHIIRDSEYTYFWSDQSPQGTKIAVSLETTPAAGSIEQPVVDKDLNYNCGAWSVDASVFELPTDKEFVDLSQTLEQLPTVPQPGQGNQCAACASLQEPAKTQCLQALSCS